MNTEPEYKVRKVNIVQKDQLSQIIMLSKEDCDKVYEINLKILEYKF